ncbi:hypothetical protein ACPXB5_01385 [Micromonospora arida]|uniref:hypothetical protein n=1 Tax=Micromonospora arida TaxID=2203715 RepID=UPI000F5DF485|nr:hypothetical protein [Micromonospora arida]
MSVRSTVGRVVASTILAVVTTLVAAAEMQPDEVRNFEHAVVATSTEVGGHAGPGTADDWPW